MAWTTKILKVLGEYRNKEGQLKSKWEITQPWNDEKHFAPGIQKTSFYLKDGIETRGFAQALTSYDLNYIRDNWATIRAAMDPAPTGDAPAAQATPPADIEEVPF